MARNHGVPKRLKPGYDNAADQPDLADAGRKVADEDPALGLPEHFLLGILRVAAVHGALDVGQLVDEIADRDEVAADAHHWSS